MSIPFIEDFDFNGKKVLMRVDFNTPVSKNRVTDDTRIRSALKSINYIIENGGKLMLMSHLGRPKGKIVEDYRLDPVADRLTILLKKKVKKLNDCIGEQVKAETDKMENGDVVLLENLRFHQGEKSNNPEFAKSLAKLCDIYINDAFGACHREHASIAGICQYVEKKGMGYLIRKEIDNLSQAVDSPQAPFFTILGGAKVSGKIDLINNISDKVDLLLIGGGMMFTFLKAKGLNIGNSIMEEDKIELAGQILEQHGNKILLPEDVRIVQALNKPESMETVAVENIPDGFVGIDIGPKTEEMFGTKIQKAKTVLFNGPMGIFETKEYSSGTVKVLEAVAGAKCISIIGGGDSAAAANKFGFTDVFTHISTGGGASLEFLSGKPLPGIESLKE